jgi:hypothetical protein
VRRGREGGKGGGEGEIQNIENIMGEERRMRCGVGYAFRNQLIVKAGSRSLWRNVRKLHGFLELQPPLVCA